MGIVELRRTAKNEWKAKYQGNYGLYTIKITTAGGKTVKSSCSCPSGYYPCKHIPIIERAIAGKTAGFIKQGKDSDLETDKIIENVPAEKLREFVSGQAQYNDELRNAVYLEFTANIKSTQANKYSGVIRKALADIPVWHNDDYYEETCEIDILDKWFDKAQYFVKREKYGEAILICKACIEEFSQWLYNGGEEFYEMFPMRYQSVPFDILEDTAKHVSKKELFDYCLCEMKKEKYANTAFDDGFHRLLATLALELDPDTFISMQDQLLAGIADKSCDEAETVLRRKIDFYRRLGQAGKAQSIQEENIQINSFRLEVVERKIGKQDFAEAKKLIGDFLQTEESQDHYLYRTWRKLLLDIAGKENDVPAIRDLAYGFIKDGFQQEYYEIYKAAFTPGEWIAERKKLLHGYDNKKYFSGSVADFLVAEGDTERLMDYIAKYHSPVVLAGYYKSFAAVYPEKTLELFEKTIVSYSESNTGRSHYECVFSLLQKMSKIKGGKKEAADLAAALKLRYKNRRAMVEILQRL